MTTNPMTANAAGLLQTPVRGLWATPAAPLPFLRNVVVRSFLLEREQGNILVYNAPGISAAAREILDRGRPERLLVNHWHEAMYGAPTLDVPIFVHERDRRQTGLPLAGTVSKREQLTGDLEVIPTPGHTAGTTAFLWDNGEHRMLFPGDSIWVRGGRWQAVLLGESDREAYLASLATLIDVEFDVLVPWGAEAGQACTYPVTRLEARNHLKAILSRLEAGENT